MATPSIKFKKLIIKLNQLDRSNVVGALSRWVGGITCDPKIQSFSSFLSRLEGQCFLSSKELENDFMLWSLANCLNDCITFQEVVKSKLAIPKKNIDELFKKEEKKAAVRKTIPKKTRETVWSTQFGGTTDGKCYCCSGKITALGMWHVGHVIAQSSGGNDTPDNLRAVCVSCNLDMGTENMEVFKNRCYPS
jgi:5-methylcytosine-specific restriction endonuclease McrA